MIKTVPKKWSEVKSLSRVQLFAIPWAVAYQAPPSLGFSRQEYWSGLPFPSPGDLPNPEIEPGSPVLQADALPSEPPGKSSPRKRNTKKQNVCLRRSYKSLRKEEKWKAKKKGKDIPIWMQTDKKDFLSEWYKEIEESNRMGKTRDLFRKIRDT